MNHLPRPCHTYFLAKALVALACIVLLGACGQAGDRGELATSSPLPARTTAPVLTPTLPPTFTATAEAGEQVTLIPRQTQSIDHDILPPTATPSRTPTATPTATPTPLSYGDPPTGQAEDYTLETWDGSEAWSMIAADPPTFPQNDEGRAYDDYDWASVKLTLLRELVSRFPASPHYPEAAALLISPESYFQLSIPVKNTLEPFRAAFESALNANPDTEISSEALEALISRQLQMEYIRVAEVIPADNVLGDGAPGWILDVRDLGSSGTALVITGKPGAYHVVSPRQDWRRFMWSDQEVSSYDLNANGIPEIAIHDSYWGTGFTHYCSEIFQLYEWNGSGFVNLTPGIQTSANTDFANCLDFEMVAGPGGTQAITTGNLIRSGCSYGTYDPWWGVGSLKIQRRYEWNGTYFALVREEVLPLESSMPEGEPLNKCTLSWVNEAGAMNDQAFDLLPALLSETDPYLTARFANQFGPAYPDYFRFKLGTWYAMRGRQSQALALLTQVRDDPANPGFEAASQLAEAFLQNYPSTSAFAGCVAANQVLDIHDFPVGDFLYLSDNDMRAAWGFSDPQWAFGGGITFFSGPSGREDSMNVCSLNSAFRLSVRDQFFASTEGLTRWLNSQQIPYTGLEEGDVDGDGRRDWLLMLGTGDNGSFRLWVLLNKSDGILPLWVSNAPLTTSNVPTVWNTFTPNPPDDLLNVYQWTDGMMIFRVVSHDDWTGIDKIFDGSYYFDGYYHYNEAYRGFTVRPSETGSLDSRGAEELYVSIVGDGFWGTDWYTLGWDPTINTLGVISSTQMEQDGQVQLAESLLFEESDPKAAIDILNGLLSDETELVDEDMQKYDALPKVQPYLQYLLGLAYEMNGDEQEAIAAYWNLWNTFPLHPLSYVVQHKISSPYIPASTTPLPP